jgi:hypothetical protein
MFIVFSLQQRESGLSSESHAMNSPMLKARAEPRRKNAIVAYRDAFSTLANGAVPP